MPDREEGWHISKSVPATLLLGLMTQAAAIVWTVSMMMADIQQNTEKLIAFSERVNKGREHGTEPSSQHGPYRRKHQSNTELS